MRKLLALVVIVAACGGGSSSVNLADYPDELHEAFCKYYERCGMIEDVDTCLATNIGTRFRTSASEQGAITAGKLKFDKGAASKCADALAARDCDVTSASARLFPAPCFEVTVGVQGDGEACAVNDECQSNLCDVPVCDGACCQGSCVGAAPAGPARVGESCASARCEDNAYCDEGTCVARKNAGAACIFADDCQFGLDCVDAECAALPTLDQPCEGACRDAGTRCDRATAKCAKVALAGEACAMTSDCSPFYVCDPGTKTCVAGLALGATCTKASASRCAGDGAFCEVRPGDATGICSLPIALGQPCATNNSCDSLTCDALTGLCVAEPACF